MPTTTGNTQETKLELLKTRVENAGFTSKIATALVKNNILTVGGIVSRSKEEIKRILGLSTIEINSIFSQINDLGGIIQEEAANRPIEIYPTTEEKPEQDISLEVDGEDDIVEVLARQLGFKKEDIARHTRKQEVVNARDIIIYLLREYGDMSYPGIGRLLDRDHTTVIHAYTKLKDRYTQNPELEKILYALVENVKAVKERKIRVETDLIPNILASMEPARERVRTITFKIIPERNIKILNLYREGLTLQNISNVVGVTRERVRQVVVNTIKQNAINESITKGIVMDSEILAEEEAKKRKAVQEAKRPIKPKIKKEKRWSRYYLACRSCKTTVVPHVKKGYCENCIGSYRGDRRDEVINRHGGKCDVCQIERGEAVRKYGRDFYITKDQKVLCRRHFLEMSGRILGKSRRDRLA